MGLPYDGKVEWHGAVLFSDFRTLLGGQDAPPISITDYLGSAPFAAMDDTASLRSDPELQCVYTNPVFVPFHNVGQGTGILDNDAYLAGAKGLPRVRWDIESAPASGFVQCYADTSYNSQYLDFSVPPDKATGANLTAICDAKISAAGKTANWYEQGFRLYFSRLRFGGYSETSEPQFDVRFKVSGDTWTVSLLPSGGVSIFRNGSCLRGGGGGHAGGGGGAVYPASTVSRMGCLFVAVMNGRVRITLEGGQFGGATPFTSDAYASAQGEVVADPLTGQFKISENLAAKLLKAPFKATLWDKGKAPGFATASVVEVSGYNKDGTLQMSGGRGTTDSSNIGVLDPRIEGVSVEANDFTQITLSLHPLRFATTGTMRSVLHQTGFTVPSKGVGSKGLRYRVFTPQTALTLSDGGSESLYGTSGGEVKVTTSPGISGTPFVQYDLEVNNEKSGTYAKTDYADESVCLLRVTAHSDGVLDYSPPASQYVEFGTTRFDGSNNGYPLKGFEESWTFSPGEQTINHTLSLTLDNFYGIGGLNRLVGVNGAGNIGVALRWGYKHLPNGGSWFGGGGTLSSSEPGVSRFVGYAHSYGFDRSQGNHGTVTLECSDQMLQLSDMQLIAPPNMDGWNHYYAVAWLLQYAGIPKARMRFASLIPEEPDEAVEEDKEPYFLPLGVGMNPWTPVNSAVSVRELLSQIQKATGFLLFFDAYGQAAYEPWLPTFSGNNVVREFRTDQDLDYGYNLVGMESFRGRTSTLDVRNQVALIGIDAFSDSGWYTPIVNKLEDEASIKSLPGRQPINYKGYRSPFVWADSRFATEAFARDSAMRLFKTMRLPEVSVSFSCWGQPDIFPLDPIAVREEKSGAQNTIYRVFSVSTRLAPYEGSMRPKTSITARLIDPTAIG